MCYALAVYVKLLFVPVGLHMERWVPIIKSALEINFLISVALLILILMLWIKLSKPHKFVSFCILWFLIALLSVFNIVKLNAMLAEHWLYLPSIGLFMVIGYGVSRLFLKSLPIRRLTIIALAALVGIYSGLTIIRNADWSNPVLFYQKTLHYTPQSPRLHYNLGLAYVENNQFDEAVQSFKKAVELNPKYEEAYSCLGNAYSMKGLYDKAKEAFEKSLQIDPDSDKSHNGLGIVYDETGQYDQAIDEYKKALKTDPKNAKIHYNLANAYFQKGLPEMSIEEFKKSLSMEPHNYIALYNLGVIYYQKQMFDEALYYLNKSLQIQPNSKSAQKLINDINQR